MFYKHHSSSTFILGASGETLNVLSKVILLLYFFFIGIQGISVKVSMTSVLGKI